jgi:hypothetical protein
MRSTRADTWSRAMISSGSAASAGVRAVLTAWIALVTSSEVMRQAVSATSPRSCSLRNASVNLRARPAADGTGASVISSQNA